MNVDIVCALCSRALEAGCDDGKVIVRPCACAVKTAKRQGAKAVERPPAPDLNVLRWDITSSPVRRPRMGQNKKAGKYVRLVDYTKLARRNAWLDKCIDRMLGAGNFVTCPQCRLPNIDGYICSCGYADGENDGEFEA